MSIKAMSHVWEVTNLNTYEKFVLLALADYCNHNLVAWPSVQTLAEKVRMSKNGVRNILERLVAMGALEVKHRKQKNGLNRSSLYRIVLSALSTMPPDIDGTPGEIEDDSDDDLFESDTKDGGSASGAPPITQGVVHPVSKVVHPVHPDPVIEPGIQITLQDQPTLAGPPTNVGTAAFFEKENEGNLNTQPQAQQDPKQTEFKRHNLYRALEALQSTLAGHVDFEQGEHNGGQPGQNCALLDPSLETMFKEKIARYARGRKKGLNNILDDMKQLGEQVKKTQPKAITFRTLLCAGSFEKCLEAIPNNKPQQPKTPRPLAHGLWEPAPRPVLTPEEHAANLAILNELRTKLQTREFAI